MNIEDKKKFSKMAEISKALAHSSRLFILHKLDAQELCVKELAQLIGSDISTVSKHLAQLKNVGLVTDEKRGNCVYYHLQCRCVLNIFSCVENVISATRE